MSCVSAIMYYSCVHAGGVHTCDEAEPGATQSTVSTFVDIIGTRVLLWGAFWCLKYSNRTAGVRHVAENNEATDVPNDELTRASDRCCWCCVDVFHLRHG